jgi:aspartate-semialdehyde dehydrogenase
MVMALAPIHKKYGVKRVVVSTYQSISGTGKAAVEQMNNERNGVEGDMVYPHKIDMNCLPHCDVFMDNGYTKEEMKIMNETKKILSDDSIKVTATAVRVPVSGGHSESVNVTLNSAFEVDEIRYLLSHTEGITVSDDIKNNVYPTPLTAHQKDDVFVGRIRRDDTLDNSLNMWIVADNLRKGAATNAIQIAEYLVAKNMV